MPHISGVIILGVAAFCAPCFTVFGVECKAMAKDKDITSPLLELGGALGLSMAAGFNGLFLWMNQSWGRHLKEREEKIKEAKEEKKLRIETERIEKGQTERLTSLG